MSTVLDDGPRLLASTPALLRQQLTPLPPAWLDADEGPDTWSPRVIAGHLVHGERTDWMPRVHRLLEHGESLPFEPFDRFAQLAEGPRPLTELLDAFAEARAASLEDLAALDLGPADLDRRGSHPALGVVSLGQLLSAWVAHDLAHLAQIQRVLARQLREAVGPWREYITLVG